MQDIPRECRIFPRIQGVPKDSGCSQGMQGIPKARNPLYLCQASIAWVIHPDLSAPGLPRARGMCELGAGNNSLSESQDELDFSEVKPSPSLCPSVCNEIDQWPPPVPGQSLNLPVMGVVIQVPGLGGKGPALHAPGWEIPLLPTSPPPSQLESVIPALPAGEDPIPGGQAGLQPSEAVQSGGEGARREELDPGSCWETFWALSASPPGCPARVTQGSLHPIPVLCLLLLLLFLGIQALLGLLPSPLDCFESAPVFRFSSALDSFPFPFLCCG